jgi:hypothetical protein
MLLGFRDFAAHDPAGEHVAVFADSGRRLWFLHRLPRIGIHRVCVHDGGIGDLSSDIAHERHCRVCA